MSEIKSICVYCGSQSGKSSKFVAEAIVLGQSLAENGIKLVYGGGDKGIMGAVSSACRENNGNVTGIIPRFLIGFKGETNVANPKDLVIVTENMHERKQHMFEEADAFIALPGGVGTLEEIVEIMTWAQLDRHHKPIAVLNTDGFWDPMLNLLDHMKASGFLHNSENVQPIVINNAADVVEAIRSA